MTSKPHSPGTPSSSQQMPAVPQESHPHPSPSSPPRKGDKFGLEGTNKTVPVPQPDGEPSQDLPGTKTKFVPKSPHTRG